jgi:gliding motility-associated-like protein
MWATYLGGPGPENGYSVATDNDGNVYIAGETSNSPNIATGTGWQVNSGGNYDAYLAKFDANGSMLWSTYYGGTGADYGRSVITDSHGNVYLAGNTSSATGIASPGAHQTAFGGGTDAFLVKFNKNGVRKWASYYGGTGTESGFGVAVDTHDNVYLTGLTGSTTNISTPGSFQPAKDAGNDAYLVKFDSNGVRRWGTYYGGNNSDNSTAIRIDREDMVYITGNTSSTNNLATASSQQATNNGNTDAFLAKFDTSGQRTWSTYYGGTGTDNGRQVNTDNNGNVYLSGSTASSTGIATPDAIQPAYGGNTDAYLVKFDKNGVRKWGTYFGGTDMDIASASVTDAQGKLYMTGATQSLQIATMNAFQYPYGGGGNDAFLLKIDEQYSFILKAGNCVTMHYYYDASSALAGTHDFSFALQTDKISTTDPAAIVHPEADGFHGSLHSSDDVSIVNQAPVCQPGDKITLGLRVIPIQSCGSASYTMATITINNSSGMSVANTVLNLNLGGNDAFLSSELYGSSPIPAFPRPDISDSLYPAVKYALLNKSGLVSIPIYNIPAGVSSINIGISTGISTISFSAQLTGIPAFFNASSQSNTVIDQGAVTLTALPSISGWNFPVSIAQNQTLQLNGISTANAKDLQWVSATAGNLPNNGTMTNPALTYTPTPADIANGYIMLSMTILNDAGCDASQTAFIKIDNVPYDYGDAPLTYDLLQAKTPFSAASTLYPGLYLGTRPPNAEPQAKSSPDATGDGMEEDGLIEKCPLRPIAGKVYTIKTAATNNTGSTGYLYAFVDWNADGDYLDPGEQTLQRVTIAPGTGLQYYNLSFTIPAAINAFPPRYFIRLRLSLDSSSVRKAYGPAAGGETEDHQLVIGENQTSFRQISICRGDSLKTGSGIYRESGDYYDILAITTDCDSIIHIRLTVKDCGESECGPFVPTAFTPNGDGNNEGFRAIFRCPVSNFNLVIYNRWGQKVFESNDPKTEWNGRFSGQLQSTGVFIWYCRYVLNGLPESRKGTVTLIR